ncbi:MAG: UvrD-helicase domain-containing protein [Geminicoccaceae bacterium]|nr:UvrD-helicase domain-containing protein [Geminicoccaceae bacterium]MCX7629867.1 UvrD-helicase domain-containing protein [Geminicoccaceae bacterium]MDW8124100.1 UvrD-helicase domain-containing protein [Geminicoccaceae bacterium]MDW8340237.1 UvrD-helicase domain-containing protein [Geminicoccaceae bacterium]
MDPAHRRLPRDAEGELAHLCGLNPEQRAAVTAPDGPLLVLAGAGTGKTRVLTARLAHFLVSGRARAGEIFAVTFTNKAAREMAERVERMIGRSVEGMWLGTFHAMGVRLLRAHAELVGLEPTFTILDTDDQLRLLKQVIQAADLDERRWPARALLALVERWKDKGWTPEAVPECEVSDFAMGEARALYAAYQERLRVLNACDFGDLLLHGLEIFNRHPDVLARYQERFRAILVDEYQDTNVAQYLWLKLLAQRHGNITCVGDDDQSIYSWRGADVGNILRFEQDFPGARIVRLERNYRSTGHILGAATGLIAHNRARHGKTLWTEGAMGEPVRVAGLWDDEEEARWIGEEIEALQRAGERLSSIAVLVRAGFQTRAFEERFIQMGLPYRVVGGPRFYERQEIRDAIAYLRLVASPDDDLAFERIVNLPRRGIGETSLRTLRTLARRREASLLRTARELVRTDELPARTRSALSRFLDQLDHWRTLLAEKRPRDLAEIVLEESGYVEMWQNERSADAQGRLDNLKELVKSLEEFDTLPAFLEHVALVTEATTDPEAEMVSVMTLHGAKGLEFDSVFLAGWEEGLFPNARALEEGGERALEEERRLAYVGITRAKKRCVVTFAANRRVYGQWTSTLPSRFLEELPREHIEVLHRSPAARPDREYFGEPEYGPRASRFRSRRATANALLEGKAEILLVRPAPGSRKFRVGERIFHEKFGYGRIEAIDGDKLEIAFDKAGRKKVVDSFVEPA